MSPQGFFRAILLSTAIAAPMSVSMTAHATASTPVQPNFPQYDAPHGDDYLSHKARKNQDLEVGDYAFADLHKSGRTFLDEWSFTLADSADITVSLLDFTLPGMGSKFLFQDDADNDHAYKDDWYKENGHGKGNHKNNSHGHDIFKSLLDNKYLTVSLFDEEGDLLGTAGENGTLSALGLAAGQWYTLAVSGKAVGMLGGIYHGNLSIESAAPVPIGDTLPLFASALLVFGLRSKKVREAIRI